MRKLATTFICFFAASNFSLADPLLFKEEIPKEDVKLNYPIVEYLSLIHISEPTRPY